MRTGTLSQYHDYVNSEPFGPREMFLIDVRSIQIATYRRRLAAHGREIARPREPRRELRAIACTREVGELRRQLRKRA